MSGVTVTCQRCAVQIYAAPGDAGPLGTMLAHYREAHGPAAAVVRCEWCLGSGVRQYIDRITGVRHWEDCAHCAGTGRALDVGVAG